MTSADIRRFCALVACLFLWSSIPARADDAIRPSVVKVLATRRGPDVIRPWIKQPAAEQGGTGIVIDGKRILTNAHVVTYASQVYVQGYQSPDKVAAKVAAIAPGIDLAVLQPEDEAFFAGRPALPMADPLPALKDKVNVYGYPIGGTELSVTEGVVSRVEFEGYNYNTMGLRIQVDAALNPGNSGGPAVSRDRVVGLVFSRIAQAENIGYLIPVEEIRTFLADIADGKYDGKPAFRDGVQTTENESLRAKLGLPKDAGGVMVREPYLTDAAYPLKEWDVITRVGEHRVESDGKVRVREDRSFDFRYLVQQEARGGTVGLTILRDGKAQKIDLPLNVRRADLIAPLETAYPRYFIYGPLVFSPATAEYFAVAGEKTRSLMWLHQSPMIARYSDRVAFEGEELVIVASPLLPHRISKGYGDPVTCVVGEVNGVRIRNLRHLAETLRDATGTYVVFKFQDRRAETLVFRRAEITAAAEEILTDNGIRQPYSDDLRDVMEKR